MLPVSSIVEVNLCLVRHLFSRLFTRLRQYCCIQRSSHVIGRLSRVVQERTRSKVLAICLPFILENVIERSSLLEMVTFFKELCKKLKRRRTNVTHYCWMKIWNGSDDNIRYWKFSLKQIIILLLHFPKNTDWPLWLRWNDRDQDYNLEFIFLLWHNKRIFLSWVFLSVFSHKFEENIIFLRIT